jgi:hypothetical protein
MLYADNNTMQVFNFGVERRKNPHKLQKLAKKINKIQKSNQIRKTLLSMTRKHLLIPFIIKCFKNLVKFI